MTNTRHEPACRFTAVRTCKTKDTHRRPSCSSASVSQCPVSTLTCHQPHIMWTLNVMQANCCRGGRTYAGLATNQPLLTHKQIGPYLYDAAVIVANSDDASQRGAPSEGAELRRQAMRGDRTRPGARTRQRFAEAVHSDLDATRATSAPPPSVLHMRGSTVLQEGMQPSASYRPAENIQACVHNESQYDAVCGTRRLTCLPTPAVAIKSPPALN